MSALYRAKVHRLGAGWEWTVYDVRTGPGEAWILALDGRCQTWVEALRQAADHIRNPHCRGECRGREAVT